MKILFYSIIGVVLLIGLLLIVLSIASRKQPELGLVNGQLRPCPATPNCVCSEWPGAGAFIEPLHYSIARDAAWDSIKQAIISTGGEIVHEQNAYLQTRYVTPLLRYVDDVELRLDEDRHVIHIRSASRVGRSDLGANRQRVSRIKNAFDRQVSSNNNN